MLVLPYLDARALLLGSITSYAAAATRSREVALSCFEAQSWPCSHSSMLFGPCSTARATPHSRLQHLPRPAAVRTPPQNLHRVLPRQQRLPMSCPDCMKGSLDEGTPRGEEVTVEGIPCYLSRPSKANGAAIILGSDIFGYKLINARLVADVFADAGYTVAVPDYFKGKPFDLAVLETFESLPSRNIFSKIGAILWLVTKVAGMSGFLKRNPSAYAEEVATKVAAWLRSQQGASKVGLQGYCYGGTLAVLMASKPDIINAASAAHPGPVTEAALQAVAAPLLFLCAETDFTFGPKQRTRAQQLLEEKAPGLSTFILYPGTNHGFAMRGNKAVPAINAAREDALKQGLKFFNQHLLGVAAPEVLTGGSVPVGKRLQLAPRQC